MARIKRDPKPPAVKVRRPINLREDIAVGALAAAVGFAVGGTPEVRILVAVAIVGAFFLGKSLGEAHPDPVARGRVATLEAQRDYVQQLAVGTLVGLRREGAAAANGRPGAPESGQPEARPAAPPLTTAQRNQRLRSVDAPIPGDEAGGVE